jgi:hypothetical protein
MSDGLLSASVVRLFGRKIDGVTLSAKELKKSLSANRQLVAELKDPLALARIYAFSFEGQFYTLPKPMLYLVHGDGDDPMGDTGLANINDLKFENDIMRWNYDKDDVLLRSDVVIGTLDDVLVDAALSPTPKYPIVSRAGRPQEASWRDGQMIARNRLL